MSIILVSRTSRFNKSPVQKWKRIVNYFLYLFKKSTYPITQVNTIISDLVNIRPECINNYLKRAEGLIVKFQTKG